MTVLHVLTGGTGFLGGFLVRDLLAKGAPLRVLARPSPRAEALSRLRGEIVHGILARCRRPLARAFAGVDTVYHLAAKVGAPGSRHDYFEANVAGTERALKAGAARREALFTLARSRFMDPSPKAPALMKTRPSTNGLTARSLLRIAHCG